MSNALEHLSDFLAKNLLSLRVKRGFTQGQLARIAGIPRSTLTHLESGEGNPSLQTLAKVSAALQVGIEEILSRPRAECKHIKSSEVPRVKRSGGTVTLLKLLPDPIPGMEIDRMELDEGARVGGVPHVANSKEYFVCIKGKVQISVPGAWYELVEGDVLAFPGDQAHSYRNVGKGMAVGMSVVAIAPLGV
jgi:transcriptional regulator with XRE-family HTH domain